MTRGVPTDQATVAKMRAEFISSEKAISQEALGEKYGIPYWTVVEYARNEKWVEQRREYFQKLAEESLKCIIDQVSAERAEDIKTVRLIGKSIARKLIQNIEDGSYDPTPADLDKIVRLGSFVMGGDDMRVGIRNETAENEFRSWIESLRQPSKAALPPAK